MLGDSSVGAGRGGCSYEYSGHETLVQRILGRQGLTLPSDRASKLFCYGFLRVFVHIKSIDKLFPEM